MREIGSSEITKAVAQLCKEANFFLPKDVFNALREAWKEEGPSCGRAVIEQILENIQIARKEKIALCQDCGTAIVFLELGQEVHIVNGDLYSAVNEGVRQGYKKGYLRNSMCDPFTRQNTGDNTPAEIHTEIVPGNKLKIFFCPKGGGAENMSALKMLNPGQGREGVKEFVIETVKDAGANPCPPTVVGVGIGGGTFNAVAWLAKKALFREIQSHNKDPKIVEFEKELLEEINKLGIGPAGLGGRNTALAVLVEIDMCHIASLPVAVNIQCHCARHGEVIL